jgi:hypothetical protein
MTESIIRFASEDIPWMMEVYWYVNLFRQTYRGKDWSGRLTKTSFRKRPAGY